MQKKSTPSSDILAELYRNEGLSLRAIAKRFGISRTTIRYRFRRDGIELLKAKKPCPRKGNPKARNLDLRVDCPNLVIQPPTGGPGKHFCSRRCAAAVYRQNNTDNLAQLKKDWWTNLSDAEKAEVKKRQEQYGKDHRLELNARRKAWRDRLPPEGIEALNQRNKDWRDKQKARLEKAEADAAKAEADAAAARAKAERILAAAEAKPKRRTKETKAKIVVGAYLELRGGWSEWDMGPVLYPEQRNRDKGYKDVYKFLRENRIELDAEKVRLQTFSLAEQGG